MQAKDVMTTRVVTVDPETAVEDVARLLIERHVSGVPVVDAKGAIVGIVSEGDLMRRAESGTERRTRSWWLSLFDDTTEAAAAYAKARGRHARDVMTTEIVSVAPETPLGEIAELLERRHIKRVPVLKDGKLVGIVSRANLLQGLASARRSQPTPPVAASDQSIRDQIVAELQKHGWGNLGTTSVVVRDGVVQLWGLVGSDQERRASVVAAENVAGVKSIEDHRGILPKYPVLGV